MKVTTIIVVVITVFVAMILERFDQFNFISFLAGTAVGCGGMAIKVIKG